MSQSEPLESADDAESAGSADDAEPLGSADDDMSQTGQLSTFLLVALVFFVVLIAVFEITDVGVMVRSEFITLLVAIGAAIAPFVIVTATEKDRQQFVKGLVNKIEQKYRQFTIDMDDRRRQFTMDVDDRRRQFTMDMDDRHRQFKMDVENVREINRRKERALDTFRDEIGSIKGSLHRIVEWTEELPKDTHSTIRIPSELRKIVTIEDEADGAIEDEANEAIQEDDSAQQGTS